VSDESRFGFTLAQWELMVDVGLAYLEGLARGRGQTDYTTFCSEVRRAAGTSPQPGDHALAFLLGDIAHRSYNSNGVVVTALVHYKDRGFSPGPGFYSICQELDLLRPGKLTEDQRLVFLV
jgi:hypothetical protein